MKMLASLLRIIIVIFGTTCISVQGMKRSFNELSLHSHIAHYSSNKIFFTAKEKEILHKAYVSTDKRILNCTSEQEVYNMTSDMLKINYEDLLHYLKRKRYVMITSKDTSQLSYMFTHERLTQLNDFYNKKGYNSFKESPAVQTDSHTVLWKNRVWKNTVLVPKENLSLLYTATKFFNINEYFFISTLSESDNLASITFNNQSSHILPENYGFILHLSRGTAKKLTSNPILCLPFFLHHLIKLTNGDGLKTTALDKGTQYCVLESGKLISTMNDQSVGQKKIAWQRATILFADIAAIICPPNNEQFNQDERQMLYKLSLKILCEEMVNRLDQNNDHPFSMQRISVLLHLYTLTTCV